MTKVCRSHFEQDSWHLLIDWGYCWIKHHKWKCDQLLGNFFFRISPWEGRQELGRGGCIGLPCTVWDASGLLASTHLMVQVPLILRKAELPLSFRTPPGGQYCSVKNCSLRPISCICKWQFIGGQVKQGLITLIREKSTCEANNWWKLSSELKELPDFMWFV